MTTTIDIHQHRILILDFGSQYCQLIARCIRDIGVYCEIFPYDTDNQTIIDFAPQGVILSGGPETVCDHSTPRIPQVIFQLKCPILGICYGMQALAEQLGGQVALADQQEFGYAHTNTYTDSPLWQGIAGDLDTWMSHGDHVRQLPPEFETIATTTNTAIAAMANEKKRYYGLQFHPEVTHTPQGKHLLRNFVCTICQCDANWTTVNIIDDICNNLKQKLGNDRVILGLSGGVDSSVVAALLHRAIGKNLTCIFIDNGLLRLHEGDEVERLFAENMDFHIIRVNAQENFLNALVGVADPEEKRKVIGRVFIEVFEKQAKQLNDVQWLAQGTIYPDVIESAACKSGKAKVIKSHHNVGGLPEKLHFKLVEPLRDLFKDEVRAIGLALDLPASMIQRHPFPGPGLGVRMLGEIQPRYLDSLRQADAIFIEELHHAGLYHQVNQAFAVFLPIRSVGVVGDDRRYEPVIALRAVETIDFMTARWAYLPHAFLDKVSTRIINEIKEISRVVYDISGKPPATIEWE